MPLININADLSRTAAALESIAAAVQQLVFLTVRPDAKRYLQNVPVPPGFQKPKTPAKPAGPEALSTFNEEEAWSREQEAQRRQSYRTPEDNLPPMPYGLETPPSRE